LGRMMVALEETWFEPSNRSPGLQTNLTFLRRLVVDKDLILGQTATDYISLHPELTHEDGSAMTSSVASIVSLAQCLDQQSVLKDRGTA